MPKGRLAEDGTINEKYSKLTEMEKKSYRLRTEQNILDADATITFVMNKLTGGTKLTRKLARKYNKPNMHINFKVTKYDKAIEKIINWLKEIKPGVLNVAGSRKSKEPGIYDKVYNTLKAVLNEYR